jgi:hypothetical protein
VTEDILHSLEFAGDLELFIKDGSFRWIVASRFEVPTARPQDPSGLLRTLIDHPRYWHAYISPRRVSYELGVHGPYRLDGISAASFRPVDSQSVDADLHNWLHRDGDVPRSDINGDIEEIPRLVATADRCFQLPDLGEPSFHESGWILDKPFLEYVLFGPASQLTVVVASGD